MQVYRSSWHKCHSLDRKTTLPVTHDSSPSPYSVWEEDQLALPICEGMNSTITNVEDTCWKNWRKLPFNPPVLSLICFGGWAVNSAPKLQIAEREHSSASAFPVGRQSWLFITWLQSILSVLRTSILPSILFEWLQTSFNLHFLADINLPIQQLAFQLAMLDKSCSY